MLSHIPTLVPSQGTLPLHGSAKDQEVRKESLGGIISLQDALLVFRGKVYYSGPLH